VGLEIDARREGLGVALNSPEGIRNLLGGFMGVFSGLGAFEDASEIDGEGGVGVSETSSTVETDFVSGGVVIIGEDAVEFGDPGELGAVMSVEIVGSIRMACFLSLSCMISASILRSDNSSRNR
jgi:hypothetical protein